MRIIGFILFLCFSLTIYAETQDEIKNFIDKVNQSWKDKQYENIYILAKERLDNNSNDLLGLGVLSYYYLYGEPNCNLAKEYMKKFMEVVKSYNNKEITDFAYESMAKRIFNLPKEYDAYAKDQKEHFHEIMPEEFPYLSVIHSIAIQLQLKEE